jgi:N-acetylmuramoyl-L-alanine amidase
MSLFRVTSVLIVWLMALNRLGAAGWEEVKIGSQPYVTFESFCAFYQFGHVSVPEKDPFEVSSAYGKLQFTPNSRDMLWNGRRVWLSFSFVRNDQGQGFISKLDVIKLFDPLLRRAEMAPRKKLEGVVIDAGHGGTDDGAKSRAGYFEKNATLDTSKRLKALLDADGIPNKMTRDKDEFILLEERASFANKNSGWVFVSLHYNSGPSHAHGVETYSLTPQYSSSTGDSGRPTVKDRISESGNSQDVLNLVLADYVHQQISKLHTNEGDRGLKRARFVVLRNVKIPGVLVEGGFLSNSVDAKLISTVAYRQKMAQAVATAIKNYAKLMASPLERAPMSLQATGSTTTKKPVTTSPSPVPSQTPTPTPTVSITPSAPVPEPTPTALSPAEPVDSAVPENKSPAPVSETAPQELLSKPVTAPRPSEPQKPESSEKAPSNPDKTEPTPPSERK